MEMVCLCSKLNIEGVQAKKKKGEGGNISLMHGGGEDGKQKMIRKMGHCSSLGDKCGRERS